ncbi:MAG: DMT family transporter [Acidobacteria bacterium]|nr:DMT family transporter [Acidobacteriota bacterium]
MDTTGPTSRGMTALLSGALLLGFAAIFTKFAERGGALPLAIGFYRMLSALPFIILLAFLSKEGWGEARHRRWAILAGLLFVGDLWLWHASLRFTSAANATLMACLAPLWVALVSVAFLHARLRKRAWTGLALAMGGAAVLGLAKGARWGTGLGEALGFGASLAYGLFTVALAQARQGIGARNALLIVTGTCVVAFGILALTQHEPLSGFTPSAWGALVGVGLICQVLAWILITWGLGHVQAHAGAVGLLLQPAATVGLAWWMLHEAVKPLQGFGVLLILIGVALSASAPPLPSRARGVRT